ncbi:MAG: fibronectin/fibrinogen-binding protein [Ruminococcaceae bacterium]|nr:fibronectin/fibrinogen-binding protein [Oscillospiraceae bacterium]
MPLDGIFLSHLKEELQTSVGCRADKIHQPSKDELVLNLRSVAFSGKLLISARSSGARIHFTLAKFDNPAEPPAFCKLVRKHLSSAKITAVEQAGLDRVIFIRFMSYNEMGDVVHPFLAVELITGRANIILCEENGRILDALHRSDMERSARLIQPGAIYTLPERESKLNPFSSSEKEMAAAVCSCAKPLYSAFVSLIDGVSPLVSRELAFRVSLNPDIPANQLDTEQKQLLEDALKTFKEEILNPTAYTLKDQSGQAKDFSFLPVFQYGQAVDSIKEDGFSLLLDEFYAERDKSDRIKAKSQDILRLLTNIRNRTERKLDYRLKDLEKCKNREQLRIFGELIKANIYLVEKGSSFARLQNYYDENLQFVDIPLDPALSPSANAAKYFKEYKKTYTAEQILTALIAEDKKELIYIDSVLHSLDKATSVLDLSEIREELIDAGYIFRNERQKRKADLSKPREFETVSGFKILVGKNNRQNDLLTTKLARKNDLWFHTKNIPGSHVILITEGKEVDDASLLFAASLAAGFSKASKGENVPVDFTEVRFVKKPSGAKPGMVIYSSNRTIYAKPYEDK